MVDKSVTGIVTWLKSWFYDKDDVDGKLNTNTITSSSSFGNLGTSVGATQHQINSAINSLITGSGSGGNVSLACVSDFDLDSSDPTDVEIFLDACSGKVIDSVNKSTSGLVDTYTITYSDNTTYQFTVTNGADGSDATVDIVTNTNGWNSTTSDSKVPSEKLVKNSLDSKSDSTHSHNSHISYGRVDSTSTSTVFTATVSGVTELVDGTSVMLRNGVVTSASGFTINVNNLGAKPVYSSMHDATADTTVFNINYTMLFVYDSTRVTGGCWICYRGYNTNDNTIGYQIRTNNSVFTTTDRGYRYRIWLETDDGKYMPVNTSTSTNATANRSSAMNTRKFWLGGKIVYNSTKADYQANVTLPSGTMWQQYNFALGYSFNNTGSALTLTSGQPLYMVCTDEGGGKGKLASPYYTQTLPSTEDNKLYIYLGHMTSAVNMELALEHPIYEYKNGGIRLYRDTYTTSEVDTLLNGKSDTGHTHSGYANSTHTHTKSQITDFPNLSSVATSGSYNDLSNKPTIPTVPTNVSAFTNDSGYLTSHQDISGKLDKAQTSYKGKNVVVDSSTGNITFEDKNNHTHSQYLTEHQSLTNYIQKSSTDGLVKNDGSIDTSTYLTSHQTLKTINNESIVGSGNINITTQGNITVDSALSSTSENPLQNKAIYTALSSKADSNDIPTKTSDLTNDSGYLTSHQSLANYVQKSNTSGLIKNDGTIDTSSYLTTGNASSTYVAKENGKGLFSGSYNDLTNKPSLFSGSYNDLTNKPSIPSKTSDLTNDSGFLTSHQDISNYVQKSNTTGLLKNDGSVDTSTYLTSHQSLANYIQKSNTSGLIKNDGTIDTTSYSTFDGNYNNLTNKPTIPTQTSQLTNNSGFITSSSVPTIADNLTTNDSTQVLSAKQGKVLNTNKIETSAIATSFSSTTSDSKVPSEKLTKTELDKKITKSNSATGLLKDDGTVDTNSYLTTANASSTYVAKETGKGLFSGSYSDLSNKPSYTATVTSSTANSYKIGSINISGSSVDIYGKDTDTVFSGSYNDLTDTPSIPTDLSDLSDSNSLIPSVVTDSNGWNSTLSDEEVPSEKLVKSSLDDITITDLGIDDSDLSNIELYITIGNAPTTYILDENGTIDNSSTLFGDSVALRNSGSNTSSWNSSGYYTVKNTGSQKESMRVLAPLTGLTDNFCIEYDSYVEGSNGSSGFVIYNSSTAWEKLTDDADSNKKYWYGYNDGSFHESAFYGNTVTNQKWVHYKYTIQGNTFTMEVTYDNSTVVTHSETIHLTRNSTTKYGLDSEWQLNTTTRYKNLKVYLI